MPQSTTVQLDGNELVMGHVVVFDPTITAIVSSLPGINSGKINNGSQHTDAATIITVPSGVTWTGSISISASINSTIAGATVEPSIQYGGIDVIALAVSTPPVTLVSGSDSGSLSMWPISLVGPGTLTLHFNGATIATGNASGRQQ